MSIFTEEDEQRIRYVHEHRAVEDKKLFFEYFGDKAVEQITDMITVNKAYYLEQFEDHARSYATRHVRSIPIMAFKTVQQLNPNAKTIRKNLQVHYSQVEAAGSYYSSISGIHLVDLRAIYSNSDFRQKVNERLGNMFSISMRSNPVYVTDDIRIYENTLYLNARI
jgi:hypothetical protein